MNIEPNDKGHMLPLMSLREVVMFPKSITPLFVGREASIRAIERASSDFDKQIMLVPQRDSNVERPGFGDLFEIGTVCRILQLLRLPDGTIKVLFEGLYRATWLRPEGSSKVLEDGGDFSQVRVTPIPEMVTAAPEGEALMRTAMESLRDYAKNNKKISPDILQALGAVATPGHLADAVMGHLKLDYRKKQEVFATLDPVERLTKVYELLQAEIDIASMERRIKGRVKSQMERNQREYYLNEQIKAIHKEMGREDDPTQEVAELEKRFAEKDMPEEAREKGLREVKKLRQMPPSSAEYTVVHNYVDWILDLPWNSLKETTIDIGAAREILDADHFGLEKPKERILEYLAVQKLVNKLKGPILCLVGPPGVGKTSLVKSVARATGREYVRLSLGGVRDEAEIRGHRRTYVGALPGKIIQSLKRVKFNNPLFCLDEIDKMSMDFRGDPSAALLEVLDPEQNCAFNDHYLDLDYDLSQIFFITTANSLHAIPLPLQDRMEIIRLPGYLETEKRHIARNFLIPKQIEMHGLTPEQMQVSENAVVEIIHSYTREAGVRSLEREIATVCRKVAMRVVDEKEKFETAHISRSSLPGLLGVKKYRHGEKEHDSQIGVCTGLAYTEVGGELLVVETALMPGKGNVNTTGKLGDVMKESAQAALSYVRSRSDAFGLRRDFYKTIDIHVHVPEGATPKDGPSAGVTLVTSLVSALLGIPVRSDVAMTGEITLRGRVLPIGGLREKLLAAHRGMIHTVIIPKDNERDLKEVPAEILKSLVIKPVENADEVLEIALTASVGDIFPGRATAAPVYQSLRGHDDAHEPPLTAQ
ncbi:DNA-binding ATP-dependent protease La [uncultured delta proteobacterium]|uniref:Lon protease n=1 Tax=uncultured delta proteobacterium TaxID=34034 RepID=A0A212J2D0_9DELT|nr:DNA-binding ATP-dependent protease La [uncultured delta proteobacterium]